MQITFGEILDRQQLQENRLEICCAALRDDPASDGNLRLLTYYLARRRRHQAVAAGAMSEQSIQKARSADFDSEAIPPCAELPDITAASTTSDAFAGIALRHARALCSLYHALLERAPNEPAGILLRALIDLEERDIAMLRKLRTSHYF